MTMLTLTIGSVDFMPQYVTGSPRITSQIANQGDTMTMEITQKTGQNAPKQGAEVIFKDGTRVLFAGYISRLTPKEYGVGQLISWNVEVTDYTYLLINKFAQKAYQAQTLKAIVQDLIATNIDSGYALTTNNVQTGPVITTVAFNHISVRQCFEKLAKLTGYSWWVDYNKDIHFVDTTSTDIAPEKFTDANPGNHESVAIVIDVSQMRNSVVVQGGTQESANYTQNILGDAHAKEWVLLYPVKNMISVSLNGVSKSYGVDPTDDEGSNYFMYNPSRGALRASSGSPTPGASDVITVVYTYEIDVIAIMSSAPSIIAMKAIEGGDGVHASSIIDSTILSKDEARARAQQELANFANPIVSGTIVTRTGLLQAGSYFKIGQALTVNMPAWGILQDTPFVIQKLETTMDESGSAIEYTYTITFGGRLLSVVDFLNSIAAPEDTLATDDQVSKIFSVPEVVTIAEVITKNNNVRNVNESVAVAEHISKQNITPPFKWGKLNSSSYFNLDGGNSHDAIGVESGTDTNITYNADGANFNGSGSTIAIPNNSIGATITFSAFFKTTSTAQQALITFMSCLLDINNNMVEWYPDINHGPVTVSVTVSDGNPHLLVVTQTGTSYVIYLDGTQIASGTASYTVNTATGVPAALGSFQGSRLFNGSIKRIGFWGRVVNSTGVTALWNGGNVPAYPFILPDSPGGIFGMSEWS